jgi:hypothetical protein
MLLNLQPDWPDMSCVAYLGAIESRDPQEDSAGDFDIVTTLSVKPAGQFQDPTSGRPSGGATNIRTIPAIFARNDDARYQGVDR